MHGLQLQIASCTACGLHAERHLAVPGSGAAEAVQLMVIGEAPGAEDDRLGQPFRGMAGELLQAMLKAAGMTPESRVFYTQLVKCRPVANRPLAAEEVAACLGYLRRQIALTQPRQLLLLGRVAAQTLLGELPVEALRGRVHSYEQDGMTIPAVVTFHPAALLSRPRHKASAWQDLSLLGRL
jgi:DNA polymerase